MTLGSLTLRGAAKGDSADVEGIQGIDCRAHALLRTWQSVILTLILSNEWLGEVKRCREPRKATAQTWKESGNRLADRE